MIDVETYESGLARALNTVQSDEERWRHPSIRVMLLAVSFDALGDEGDAMFRLVVDDLWHVS